MSVYGTGIMIYNSHHKQPIPSLVWTINTIEKIKIDNRKLWAVTNQ